MQQVIFKIVFLDFLGWALWFSFAGVQQVLFFVFFVFHIESCTGCRCWPPLHNINCISSTRPANRRSWSVMHKAAVIWILPHSARHELIKSLKMPDKQGTKEHSHTHTHIQKNKTIQFLLYLLLWTHFITENSESTTHSLSMLSKNLTNEKSGLSNKHDTWSTQR